MPPTAPRAQRRTKLSFDVARDAVAEVQTGWVYRSAEPQAPDVPPAASEVRPVVAEVLPPVPELAPGREAWTVAIRVPAPGQVVTSSRPVERPATSGWIESGLYVMTAPMAIGVGVMLAPVLWMLRSRLR